MAEGTVLQTMSGATVAICATLPDTYDAAGYQSTDLVFSNIGQVETHGNHGATANVATFTAVADAIVQKFKGSKNYGTMNLVVGALPSDAGQDIAEAAMESQNRYSVRIAYPLRTGEATPEYHFLDVLVTRFEWQDGSVDDLRRVNIDFEVCRKPIVVGGA